MNPPAHASPLLREAAFLLQTPSLATLQTGWIWKIERNENGADTTARRVFAVIRGLFLILCDGEMDCPIELFSLLEIGIETESVMVEREDKCEDVTRSGPGSAIPDTTTEQLVTVSRRDSTLFSFFPIESSVEQWILALQRASAALRHLRSAGRQAILPCPPGGGGGGPQDSEGRRPDATAISTLSRDTSRAQGPAADRAAALLVYETRREVEQLTEQNSRLQLSADAVTRAAGEMVEQKVTEVQLLKAQVGRLQKDKRHLREEISKLRQELSRCSTDALNNRKAAAEAREHLRRMKDDMEAAARAPGQQRLALQITRHRDRIQDLLIANRQLRAEVATAAQHFQKQKSVFDSKVRRVAYAA